jgi:hypothetical protein
MKTCLSVLLAGAIAAATAATVVAAPSGAVMEKMPGVYPMDCSKWKDPARCAALNKSIEACRDKVDDEWLECMHLPAPVAKFTPPKPRDCSSASNKERCETYNSALDACKDRRTRAEHRKCIEGQMQAPAPGKG